MSSNENKGFGPFGRVGTVDSTLTMAKVLAGQNFNVEDVLCCTPDFQNDALDLNLEIFEKSMIMQKVPREHWMYFLLLKLGAKERKLIFDLSLGDSDFDVVKRVLLDELGRFPEVYRKEFRSLTRDKNEMNVDYASRLWFACQQWIKGRCAEDFESLKELFMMEQFLKSLPVQMRCYVERKSPKSMFEAARIADKYEAWGQTPVKKTEGS